MVFLHLGDLHIGKSLGDFDLIDDQAFILDQLTCIAERNGADAVLIAGDIYDKSVPSEAAVSLFDRFLRTLSEKSIRAYIITGNHDSDERLNFGSSLFRSGGVFISAKYEGRLARETVEDESGPVNIWLLPFVKASQVRHFFPDEKIPDYDAAVRAVIAHSGLDPEQRNVLVAHQFVTGRADPVTGGSESAAVRNVGLVEKIDAGCFRDFDYVALGHIHSAQQVGRPEIRYAGSPLKYSLTETEKYATIVRLGAKGDVEVTLEKLTPMRDLRHLRGKLGQLLAKENISAPEDFIYATLTDEEPVDNAMGIFQQYYPNTVAIDYDNAHTRGLTRPGPAEAEERRSFEELISDFYRLIYGCDMDEDELELMREAAREAGVTDETD